MPKIGKGHFTNAHMANYPQVAHFDPSSENRGAPEGLGERSNALNSRF